MNVQGDSLVLLFGTRDWLKSFKKNRFPPNVQLFAYLALNVVFDSLTANK